VRARGRRKRQRLGESTAPAARLTGQRPGHVWAAGFQLDQTTDGAHRAGSSDRHQGWQNPYVEPFNSRVRDELLSVELSRAWPRPR
jgi:hypothetical protein